MAMNIVHKTPEGFQTYGNRVIGYVKDNVLYLNQPELKIMLETASQLDELKGQFPPGTQFFLPGSQESWQLGADGEPAKNEIPGTFYIDPETMNLYYSSEGE